MEEKKMSLTQKVNKIQVELKAPKDLHNKFGNYNYRSCESILEALKPLLEKYGVILTLSDQIKEIGGRIYVEATVSIIDTESNEKITTTAYAREEESKKGMDGSQITGASSSYARKYALNGLFAIDDNKDSDSTNTHGKEVAQPQKAPNKANKKTVSEEEHAKLVASIKIALNNDLEKIDAVLKHYKVSKMKDLSYEILEKWLKKIEKEKK